MNLSAGYPYSFIKNGLISSFPSAQNNIKTDVLILGGGITGALMAYYLCTNNIECTLIDARTIGLGSTCASTSMLQYELDTPLFKLIDIVGKENAIRAYKMCAESIDTLEEISKKIKFEDFRKQHSLFFSAYKKDISFIEKEFEQRKKAGFDVTLLDKKEIQKKFGFDAPNAILSDVGGYIDAYKFTYSLLQFCKNKGMKIYDRTKAVDIDYQKNGVILHTENGFKIATKKLINTTGYEVANFIEKNILILHSTYAIVSENIEEKIFNQWNKNTLMWNTANPYLYMRATNDHRIIIGGRDEDFYNPAQRDKLLKKKSNLLVKDFNKIFPEMTFNKEFSWCGTFGTTKDSLPYIGTYTKTPHTYYALGFGGNGITFSVIAAQIITDILKNKKNIDKEIYKFER